MKQRPLLLREACGATSHQRLPRFGRRCWFIFYAGEQTMCWCYVCDRATAQWETLSRVEVMEMNKKGAGECYWTTIFYQKSKVDLAFWQNCTRAFDYRLNFQETTIDKNLTTQILKCSRCHGLLFGGRKAFVSLQTNNNGGHAFHFKYECFGKWCLSVHKLIA